MVCCLLGGMIILGGVLVGVKSSSSIGKMSTFECGFSVYDNSRGMFSIQFFLVSLVFLIFDVELVLLFPFVKGSGNVGLLVIFVSVLVGGLLVEWGQEMLDWYK